MFISTKTSLYPYKYARKTIKHDKAKFRILLYEIPLESITNKYINKGMTIKQNFWKRIKNG